MQNTYYQPYWLNEDELEHYGIKSMRWGRKRSPEELKGTKFLEAKVYEVPNYFKSNPIQLPNIPEIVRTKTQKYKTKLRTSKYVLRKTGKTKISSLGSSLVNIGKKVISSILNVFKKR